MGSTVAMIEMASGLKSQRIRVGQKLLVTVPKTVQKSRADSTVYRLGDSSQLPANTQQEAVWQLEPAPFSNLPIM